MCLDESSYKPFTLVVDSLGCLDKTVRGLVDHLENIVIGLRDNELLRREWESRMEERLMTRNHGTTHADICRRVIFWHSWVCDVRHAGPRALLLFLLMRVEAPQDRLIEVWLLEESRGHGSRCFLSSSSLLVSLCRTCWMFVISGDYCPCISSTVFVKEM